MDSKLKVASTKLDTKEFELPDTLYIRDIEDRVFQGIVLQCLTKVDGITLTEGNFIDSILGRGGFEAGVKGISIEQDNKNHSVNIKIELNICYGFSIPEKAEEIQALVSEEITKLTGLHVSCVHIIFKSVVPNDPNKKTFGTFNPAANQPVATPTVEDEYNDEF